jgi:hypothetical protein
MSTQPIAAYSFLPWARQGLGVYIRDEDGDRTVAQRGAMDIALQVVGEVIGGGTATGDVPQSVQLYGPGDIIGVHSRAIVRTDSRHWITNFETNFLPHVEFYDEDFPWRYTPARPSADGKRLKPWLALVVLDETEFTEASNVLDRPLPYIDVPDAATTFPPAEELWAWAHVHVNGGLGVDSGDPAAVAGALDAAVRTDRDVAYSRLLCPRILAPNVGYHAFLIPSFETGRLAGLGLDPAGAQYATQSAWADYAGRAEPSHFPVYHRWYFRTGAVGDFEYLVGLLQPRTVDPRVGHRDIDVTRPDLNLPGIPQLGGILRLGGALRAPLATLGPADLAEYTRFEQWGEPYPHPFQTALAALVNLADDYRDQAPAGANAGSGLGPGVALDEDPLIVPPIYGRWHARVQRLVDADGDPARERWVAELNLDPRHRVSAGIGADVVRQNQEAYMRAAWQQVGKVLEANHRIRYGQFALLATRVWHTREFSALHQREPERFLALTAPVQARLLAGGVTIRHQVRGSALPTALMSKVARQALRPGGRIDRMIGFGATRTRANLLARVNAGEASAAPPTAVAANLPTGEKLAETLAPHQLPAGWLRWLLGHPWARYLPAGIALLLALALILVLLLGSSLGAAAAAALATAAALLLASGLWSIRWLGRLLARARAGEALRPEGRTPASVNHLPSSPDFRLGVPGATPAPTVGRTDSAEAGRFKESLRNLYTVDVAERGIPVPVREPAPLALLTRSAVDGLRPEQTVVPRVLGSIGIPPHLADQRVDPFGEVMVYPEIDAPMYEPLKDLGGDLFVPNVQLVANNSITLLETNQKFIEAYLVGLNHEFARELLWREYPTDQRGSYFRQFWDVRGFLADPAADPRALRERLRDIPELHRWPLDSGLGSHDHRAAQGDKEEELVLVIRGELLKKYPTAVVYAHRAAWERAADGAIDQTRPRRLAALTPAEAANPPRTLVKTPLYEAKVEPDVYFLGFDLTAESARGGGSTAGEEDPGWFFVIKERPGDPRFGLDLPREGPHGTLHTWNDLAWTDVLDTYTPGGFLRVGQRAPVLTDPGAGSDAKEQYDEDVRFQWRADTDAAELAYILFQVPVLVAVHAAEMLRSVE